MDNLSRRIFDMGVEMNRVGTAIVAPRAQPLPTVHAVFLADRLLGLYRSEEKAVVEAHRIRQGDIYAGLTWQKTSHAHSGRQVWTCDVHGEKLSLVVEPRRVE